MRASSEFKIKLFTCHLHVHIASLLYDCMLTVQCWMSKTFYSNKIITVAHSYLLVAMTDHIMQPYLAMPVHAYIKHC